MPHGFTTDQSSTLSVTLEILVLNVSIFKLSSVVLLYVFKAQTHQSNINELEAMKSAQRCIISPESAPKCFA